MRNTGPSKTVLRSVLPGLMLMAMLNTRDGATACEPTDTNCHGAPLSPAIRPSTTAERSPLPER